MRYKVLQELLLAVGLALMPCEASGEEFRLSDYNLDFSGTASGGVLTFVHVDGIHCKHVSIDTEPGESAASVAARLAAAINDKNPFGWYSPKEVRRDPSP